MQWRDIMSRFISLLVAGVIAAVAAPDAARAQGEVNLYSSRHYAADDELYKAFAEQTGIKVNVIQAGGSELIQRIQREGANSPADVFLAEDAGVVGRLHLAGLFQQVKSPILESAIPANLREPDGYWFGLTMRARVVAYHKDRVKPSDLSTYENLADPKWKKRLLVRSSGSAYNQSLVVSLIEADGAEKTEQWARGIVANMARAPKGGDRDQIAAVMAGEGDIAITNTYYIGHLLSGGKPGEYDKLGIFFPNQSGRGTHVNISGGGVLKHAPHRDNAVKFLEFLTTPDAQKIFASTNFEYPVVAGAEVSPTIKAFGEFKADPLNVGVLARKNAEAVKLMDRAGWK
jgi:iron(III) transport system substrate-binding protein